MTKKEKAELEVLQQLESATNARSLLKTLTRIQCDCVRHKGKLIPIKEIDQKIAALLPPDTASYPVRKTIRLVCGGAEGCKQGKYPCRHPANQQSHWMKDRPDEPHCGCYENLRAEYGDDLPEVTKQYDYRQRP